MLAIHRRAFGVVLLLLGFGVVLGRLPHGRPAAAAPAVPIKLANASFDPLLAAPDHLGLDARAVDPAGEPLLLIVQFNGPIDARVHDAARSLGIQLLAYIPYYSYIARVPADRLPALQASPLVRWVGRYDAALRLDAALQARAADAPSLDVLVTLFPDVAADATAVALQRLGATTHDMATAATGSTLHVTLPTDLLETVAQLPAVAWIEPVPQPALMNGQATRITGVAALRTPTRNVALFGSGQVIAIADSGLDRGSAQPALLHDDFEDGNGTPRVAALYDRVGDGAQDVVAHGTHIAGTIAGNGQRSGANPLAHLFGSSNAGVAPQARIVFQAVGRDDGTLVGIPFYPPWLYDQARTPLSDGTRASIHNNSWGLLGTAGLYGSYGQYTDLYVWQNPDYLIVFAAGNDGRDANGDQLPDATTIISPATAKNVLSVGSTRNLADTPNQFVMSSGAGPTRDGRTKPDLLAPGSVILSTASQQILTADYVSGSGTSMAAAHVSGAAALVREYLATRGHTQPSAALIKALLINGAFDVTQDAASGLSGGRPHPAAGWGRIDLPQALGLNAHTQVAYWDANAPDNRATTALQTGDSVTHTVDVAAAGAPLRITLAWSDYPATQATDGNLVNDLDLHVLAPDGQIYYPNHANNGGLGGPQDHVNNVVGIDLVAAAAGSYQIVVQGFNIPQGPQPYALVAALENAGDPNVAEIAIDGPGQYTFGATGLTLNVTSNTVATVRARVHFAVPTNALLPQDMLARYYELTITSAEARSQPLLASATVTYTDEEVTAVPGLNEADLHIHYYDGLYWTAYQTANNQTQNTLTLNDLQLPGDGTLALGRYRPTAVTIHAISADTGADGRTALVYGACLVLTLWGWRRRLNRRESPAAQSWPPAA